MNSKIDYLQKSNLSPSLEYTTNFPKKARNSSMNTKRLLQEYFSTHKKDYLEELEYYYNVNARNMNHKYHIFVVCYNELPNIPNLIKLYRNQKGFDITNLSVNFLINYTMRDNEKKNQHDEKIFLKSIDILAEEAKSFPGIAIIPKRYNKDVGGLARARKYGMDFSLYCISKLPEDVVDETFLISNEGDTFHIESDYVKRYVGAFSKNKYLFIQGKVDYPQIVKDSKLINAYCEVRECVHIGQGLFPERYPFFDGIMPIGRNYGIHPRVAALAGGIDAVPLKGAEDDLTLGTDISIFLGDKTKVYDDSISLVTNPRREILIVNDLLKGNDNDAKKMYEEFHEITSIYDHDWTYYESIVFELNKLEDNKLNISIVVNQFYQWVFRTVMKNYFVFDSEFTEIINKNRDHVLGYWEKENVLLPLYLKKMDELDDYVKSVFIKMVTIESLDWFNFLIKKTGLRFDDVSVSLDSSLILEKNSIIK